MGMDSSTPSEQPCRNHAAVVEHQQIARLQPLGKSRKKVSCTYRCAIEREHAGGRAIRERLVRDTPGRQIKMKITNQHNKYPSVFL